MDKNLGDKMDILKLQLALKKVGLFIGRCTGVMDNNTKWAIIKFCDRYGIKNNDELLEMKLNELIRQYEECEMLAYTE